MVLTPFTSDAHWGEVSNRWEVVRGKLGMENRLHQTKYHHY